MNVHTTQSFINEQYSFVSLIYFTLIHSWFALPESYFFLFSQNIWRTLKEIKITTCVVSKIKKTAQIKIEDFKIFKYLKINTKLNNFYFTFL